MSVNARLSIRNSYIDAGGTSVRSRIGVRRPNRDGVRAIGQDERVQVEVEAHVGTAGPPRVDTAHVQAVNPVGSRAHQHVVHLYLHTVGLMAVPIPLTLSMAQPLTKIVPETVAPATGVSMLTLGPLVRRHFGEADQSHVQLSVM